MNQIRSALAGIMLGAMAPVAFAQDSALSLSPPLLRTDAPKLLADAHLHFNGLTEVYGYIVRSRGLGKDDEGALARAVAAGSTLEHVRDSSGRSLTVIKADLLKDGKSQLASADGNFPYYVLRPSADGLTLLGGMFGDGYATGITDGHLQFVVRLKMSAGQVRNMRFQVRGDALVNLSPIKSDRAPFIADV